VHISFVGQSKGVTIDNPISTFEHPRKIVLHGIGPGWKSILGHFNKTDKHQVREKTFYL